MQPPVTESGPSVVDYLLVLWRWRWLVLLATLLAVVVGGVVTLALPKTYRVVAVIDTGDLSEARDRQVDRLGARLAGQGLPLGTTTPPAGDPRRLPLSVQIRRPLIELSVETGSPAEVVAPLGLVGASVVEELERLMSIQRIEEENRLAAARGELADLERRRQSRERQAEHLRRGLDRLHAALGDATRRAGGDAASTLLALRLLDAIAGKEYELEETRRTLVDLPGRVGEVQRRVETLTRQVQALRPVQLVTPPTVPRQPVRPRLRLNLAIAVVAGLLGSVVTAFLLESVRTARSGRREPA